MWVARRRRGGERTSKLSKPVALRGLNIAFGLKFTAPSGVRSTPRAQRGAAERPSRNLLGFLESPLHLIARMSPSALMWPAFAEPKTSPVPVRSASIVFNRTTQHPCHAHSWWWDAGVCLLQLVLMLCTCCLLNLLYAESRAAQRPHHDVAATATSVRTVSFRARGSIGTGRYISSSTSESPLERVVLEEPSSPRGRLAATFRVIHEEPSWLFTSPHKDDELKVLESCLRPGLFVVAYWDSGSYVLRQHTHPGYSMRQRSKRARFRFADRGNTELQWTSGQRGLVELWARPDQEGALRLLGQEEEKSSDGGTRAESSWTAEAGLAPCTAEARELVEAEPSTPTRA